MKTIILLVAFIPFLGFTQLEIKEKKEPVEIGEIKINGYQWMSLKEMEGMYVFMFRNIKYQHIMEYESFYFKTKEDVEELYTVIKNGIQEPDKEIEINLPNGDVLTLKFKKKKVEFLIWDGIALSYTAPFNLKHINSLFGKE